MQLARALCASLADLLPAFVPRHPAGPRASAFHCTFSTHTAKDAQKAKEDKEASDKEKHSDKNHSKHKQPLPSYTYASPGSSLKEAGYGISVSDPVYVVDPAPKPKSPAKGGVKIKPEEIGEDFQQPGSDGVPPLPKNS